MSSDGRGGVARRPPPHEWLRALRLAQHLRQTDVERLTHDHGGRVYIRIYAELERGSRPLGSLKPAQANALREVLGITAEEWAARSAPPPSERLEETP